MLHHQQHRIQIDVWIEQREGRRLRQDRASANTLLTFFALRGFQPVRLPRAPQRPPAIDRQEDRPGQRQHAREAGALAQRLRHPR